MSSRREPPAPRGARVVPPLTGGNDGVVGNIIFYNKVININK